jgi:capsular polysaccharide biosynthesis protein
MVIRLSDSRSGIPFMPLPQDDPEVHCPDITKAKTVLGWQPEVSLEEGLRRTIAPHGAGFANLMFCRPGTRILQLYSPNYVNPMFWYMINPVGLNYYYFIGQGERLPISSGFGDVGYRIEPHNRSI